MKRAEVAEAMLKRIKLQGKSYQTYKTYWHWCNRFLAWQSTHKPHGGWTNAEQAATAYLTHLTNNEHVSATTQNVALQAMCYMYREVLNRPLVGVSAIRSKRPDRVRDVLDESEIARLLEQMSGVSLLAVKLIYAAGLRIGDVVGLRIKDISFERCQLHIWDGKGMKDRLCQFPEVLHDDVRKQIESVKRLWERDKTQNPNGVSLPNAWHKKSAKSATEFRWYYLFPSENLSVDPMSGLVKRHHRDRSHLSREIKRACDAAGIDKRITAHNIRHSFATHFVENGGSIVSLQQLLGHEHIETTQGYTHADKSGVTASRSPLENLLANPPKREPKILRLYTG